MAGPPAPRGIPVTFLWPLALQWPQSFGVSSVKHSSLTSIGEHWVKHFKSPAMQRREASSSLHGSLGLKRNTLHNKILLGVDFHCFYSFDLMFKLFFRIITENLNDAKKRWKEDPKHMVTPPKTATLKWYRPCLSFSRGFFPLNDFDHIQFYICFLILSEVPAHIPSKF